MAAINGTNKSETINGTAQDDRIDGRQGDDIIHGGAGNDTLLGGVGRDLLFGGEGDDLLDGGNGYDELTGGAGDDRILGGNAGDVARFSGNSSDYRVEAGPLPGTYLVTDLRPGSPDGTDTLDGVSFAGFADGLFDPEDLIGQAPPNQAPVANADAIEVGEEGGQIVVLGNDSDPDGDALSVVSLDLSGAAGTASINPDGTLSYTPAAGAQALQAGQTMTDSFTYTVRDAANNESTATVTVTVVGAADAPDAADDALTLAEDAGAVDVTGQLVGNDGDIDAGDTLTVTAVQAVSDKGAAVSISPDGKVTYDPGKLFSHLEEGETATDTFTYTVTDSTGLTSTATATVTITGVTEEAPVPDAYFYVQEDGTNDEMLGSIIEFMGFEPVAVETEGTLGTVIFDLDAGILSFTADHKSSDILNYDQEQWTYFTIVNAEGERKLIGMVIEGNNDPILAVDDAVAIGEGQVSGNLWNALIGNDQDVDSFMFEILSVDASGTQGQVAFDAHDRILTYSAANLDLAPGETITDTFTYEVEDGFGSTDTATVTVTVTGGSDGSASVAMSTSLAQPQAAFGTAPASAFLPEGGEAAAAFGAEGLMAAPAELMAGFDCVLL